MRQVAPVRGALSPTVTPSATSTRTRASSLPSDTARPEVRRLKRTVSALCKTVAVLTKVGGQWQAQRIGLLRMRRLVSRVRRGKAVIYAAGKAALKVLASGLAALMPR